MQTALLWVAGGLTLIGLFVGAIYFCRRLMRRPNAGTRMPIHMAPMQRRWQRL